MYYNFAGIEKNIPKSEKIQPKRLFCDFVF
jgi:hypothetical protein